MRLTTTNFPPWNDANIERLTRLLREMSAATKFLTITASTFAPGKLAVKGGRFFPFHRGTPSRFNCE
jgi:hypothetical protein